MEVKKGTHPEMAGHPRDKRTQGQATGLGIFKPHPSATMMAQAQPLQDAPEGHEAQLAPASGGNPEAAEDEADHVVNPEEETPTGDETRKDPCHGRDTPGRKKLSRRIMIKVGRTDSESLTPEITKCSSYVCRCCEKAISAMLSYTNALYTRATYIWNHENATLFL